MKKQLTVFRTRHDFGMFHVVMQYFESHRGQFIIPTNETITIEYEMLPGVIKALQAQHQQLSAMLARSEIKA